MGQHISAEKLGGVPEGMTEIELPSLTAILLVGNNCGKLKLNAPFYDLLRRARGRIVFKLREKLRVANRAVFDDLCHSVGKDPIGKSFYYIRVTDNDVRTVEAADKVLSAVKINSGLSADRGIDRRHQSSRKLNKPHASHIYRRRKAGSVAYNSSAEREHRIRARKAFPGEELYYLFSRRKRL